MSNDRPLVIFHSPCLDGFTAAWAMWLKYPDAEFVPGIYGQEPPDCTGRRVYLLDFSYSRNWLISMGTVAQKVIILDHHKTAEAALSGLSDLRGMDIVTKFDLRGMDIVTKFDMDKSGARLAWEWFHPDEEVPLLVRLVEDRDLWRFLLPNSRALNANFFSYDYDFDTWNDLRAALDGAGYPALVAGGEAIERKHHKDIAELLPKLRDKMWLKRDAEFDIEVPCVNLPYTLASDAGNILAQGQPYAAVYYRDANGFAFSLRSVEGGMDVSEVAKLYGGGGHKHAAGFRIKSLEEL